MTSKESTDDPTMSCIAISGYGENIDELVSMCDSRPRPRLVDGDGSMLVRVLTVALAPGDCRVLSGMTSLVQGPSAFPYIPGGDLCGIVEEVHEGETKFKRGDCVIAMFDTVGPLGALAEYKIVKTSHAVLKPASVANELACAVPSSALSAMLCCEKNVRDGDRILVIGGSSGVGCHLVQMLKPRGASFVAAISTQKDLMLGLGVDRVVDYREQNWWEIPEFCQEPFDMIIDLWGTREPWERACEKTATKSGFDGGRYVTFAGDTPYMKVQHWWEIPKIVYDMEARALWTFFDRWSPRYKYHIGLNPEKGNLERLARMIDQGQFKVVLDPNSPFGFDADSVKKALHIQKGRHAHGKVVVVVSKE